MSATLDDYRVARHAEELALEAAAGTRKPGDDRDASRFYSQTGDGQGAAGRQPLTLTRWLAQTAAHKPSPGEELDALWGSVFDAVGTCQDMEDEYARRQAEANALRDAEIAALATHVGYAEIAARLGISKQRVGQYVAAHRSRSGR